jgi:D-tyrosyl-tRNA(Tyr) deacylase
MNITEQTTGKKKIKLIPRRSGNNEIPAFAGNSMRAVIQRVSEASVTIQESVVAEIGHGLLILLGIEHDDTVDDIQWLVAKIIKLRIFSDEAGAMNLSLSDQNGDVIIVSQFTLHASTKKGNRPSFIKAAKPDVAIPLYEQFVATFEKELGKQVGTGEFGAMMQVSLINEGPVTIVIDSKNKE